MLTLYIFNVEISFVSIYSKWRESKVKAEHVFEERENKVVNCLTDADGCCLFPEIDFMWE